MAKQFTGVWIPKAIYQDDKLTPTDKLILADIFNLCADDGEYFKTNETISNEINISIPSVSRSIKKLTNLNYVKCEFNGRARLIKMINTLIKLIKQPNQIDKAASSKRLDSIHSSKQLKKHYSEDLVFPYDSDDFKKWWDIWKEYRQEQHGFKYRSQKSEQLRLKQIAKESNYDEQETIKRIENAIANGWKGIYPIRKEKTRGALDARKAIEWASKK